MITGAMTTAAGNSAGEVPEGPPIPARWIDQGNEVLHELQQILGAMGCDERRKSPEFRSLLGQYKALGTTLHEVRHRVAPRPVTALGMIPGPARSRTGPLLDPGITALGRIAQAKARTTADSLSASPPVPPGTGGTAQAAAEAAAPAGPETTAVPVVKPKPRFPRGLKPFASTLGPPGSRAICRGPEVTGLQRLLAHLGFDVELTGTYDAKCYRAVQEYQKDHQIPVNGMVGAEVRRLFNQIISDHEGV